MDYLSVAQARDMSGLRLVLTAHLPGPWGEAAKAIFNARRVAYHPVAQAAMVENDELVAWTGGLRNAPIAMLDDEPPVHGWLDLVMMAERLGSGPSLLPQRSADRALALGLSAEICAPYGFGWARRLGMFEANYGPNDLLPDAPAHTRTMLRGYGFSPDNGPAKQRVVDILQMLTGQLTRQQTAGSSYMVGDRLSTIDVHWACFSQMVAPLDQADQPAMPAWLVAAYSAIDPGIAAAIDPILIAHRDRIFRDHIGLPLDY